MKVKSIRLEQVLGYNSARSVCLTRMTQHQKPKPEQKGNPFTVLSA